MACSASRADWVMPTSGQTVPAAPVSPDEDADPDVRLRELCRTMPGSPERPIV
jgi:hypothetical protein